MYYQICQKLNASAARRIVNLNSKFFVDGFVRGHITEILGWNYYFIIIYNRVSNRYSQTLSLCVHSRPRLQSSWGPPGSCRPQMGPMLVPWTLLWGNTYGMVLSSFKTLWNCICLLAILQIYVVHRSVISPFVHCVWISLYIYRVVTSLDI